MVLFFSFSLTGPELVTVPDFYGTIPKRTLHLGLQAPTDDPEDAPVPPGIAGFLQVSKRKKERKKKWKKDRERTFPGDAPGIAGFVQVSKKKKEGLFFQR